MDSILDALQEGRLFELPENDKDHALQFLAHIIEAFPQIPTGTDIVRSGMEPNRYRLWSSRWSTCLYNCDVPGSF